MIYKLLKANYVNKNNISYSEECINKMIEQYKDKKFNVYCAKDIDVVEYNSNNDYLKDKTTYGKISNVRKEDDYLICDLEFDKDKLKNIYGKCYLDSIYIASPTYENNIGKVNECEIGFHYFQEPNDDHKPASEFREIINRLITNNK